MHEDPLQGLLAPGPVFSSRLEEAFASTLPVLRRQHRLRRLGGAGVLLAAYAAGLLTVLACRPPVVEPPVARGPSPAPAVAKPAPRPPARDLEWQAVDEPDSAAELYRQAGDQHLVESNPADAVRCYGNALDAGKAEDLEVSSEDSWLLIAIKQARKKERNPCGK
jgi:hypothetical protein